MIRKILVQGLKIIVSGALIVYLLRRIGLQQVNECLQSADIFWFAGAFVLFTMSLFIGSYQWWLLLGAEGIQISWRKTVSYYFVGLFFNNFLIGGLGGDFFRIMDVKRYSKNGTGAVSTVFLDRFIGLIILSGMSVLAIPWIVSRRELPLQLWIPLLLAIGGWILIVLFLFNKSFARHFNWFVQIIIPKRIAIKVGEVYHKIHQFGHDKPLFIRIVMLSIAVQSARIMTHYFLGRSVGIMLSPIYYFLLIPIIAVVASLPVSVGGLGLREQSGVILFGIFGVHTLQAFSMEALAYFLSVVTSLPGGITFVMRKKIGSFKSEGVEINTIKRVR